MRSSSGLTVSLPVARAVVMSSLARGASPERLAEVLGFPLEQLSDIDGRLPAERMVALWEYAAQVTACDTFGLELGVAVAESRPFSVVAYLFQSSQTMGAAIERASRYVRLVVDANRIELLTDGDEASLLIEDVDPRVTTPRQALEFCGAYFVTMARLSVGRHGRPLRVDFRSPAPKNTAKQEALFECPLRYGATKSRVVFARSLLDEPLVTSDPTLHAILTRHADVLLAAMPEDRSHSTRVRTYLLRAIGHDGTSLKEVSRALGLSPRTLQRALADEGTTFDALLDEERKRLMSQYLCDSTVALAELAFLLGYSSQSAFHKAVVRWTGRTPGELRRTKAPGPSP